MLLGLGRSGTTFLAKLIDSAPDVLYRHEPDAVLPTDLPAYVDADQLAPHLARAKDYVLAMADCRHWRAADHLPIFRKAYRGVPADAAYRLLVLSTKIARRCRLQRWQNLPDLVDRSSGGRLHLIKSVSALGRARLFAEAVPGLAVIHIIRHPCAVCASLRVGIEKGVMGAKIALKPLFAQKESEKYPFSLEEIERAPLEQQIAYRWMLANDKAAADMAGRPTYLQIRYEDLCANVDRVSCQVFEHLGLTLGPQTRRFIAEISKAPTDRERAVGYFRVQRPITSAVDKWKNQLDPRTVDRISDIVSHSPLGRAYFDGA
ncbi:MAG: sulfotransferase [Rhizobiales bacterium]|nr:sulfotransferase [Hyphomicrobiales bacterium]